VTPQIAKSSSSAAVPQAATPPQRTLSGPLLDPSKFPRYHIAGSLLPTTRTYLQFIDANANIAFHGSRPRYIPRLLFTNAPIMPWRPRAAFKFTQHKREGHTDFDTFLHNHCAWNVVRTPPPPAFCCAADTPMPR